eukprot:6329318-Heterocapsa_arctica.AAC.1
MGPETRNCHPSGGEFVWHPFQLSCCRISSEIMNKRLLSTADLFSPPMFQWCAEVTFGRGALSVCPSGASWAPRNSLII